MNFVRKRFQQSFRVVIFHCRHKWANYNCSDLQNFVLIDKTKLQQKFFSYARISNLKSLSDMEMSNNDFFVIDNMPSKILINIDNPNKYRKKKTKGILGVLQTETIESEVCLPSTSKIEDPLSESKPKLLTATTSNNINEVNLPIKNEHCTKNNKTMVSTPTKQSFKNVKKRNPFKIKRRKHMGKMKSSFTKLPYTSEDVDEGSPLNQDKISIKSNDSVVENPDIISITDDQDEYFIDDTKVYRETNRDKHSFSKSETIVVEDSDEEIKFDGNFSRNYIPVQVGTAGFFRANLLDPNNKPRTNCPQKRHLSSGDISSHKSKITKKKNMNKKARVGSNNLENDEDQFCEVLDIASSSDSETDIHLNFKNDLIVNIENKETTTTVSPSSSSMETNNPESVQGVSEDEMEESNAYRPNSNASNSDDNDALDQDAVSKVAIEVNDSDFVPFTDITLDNIEYFVRISDEVNAARKRYESLRRWELTRLGEKILRLNENVDGTVFTVLSYNLLAQQLIHTNRGIYRSCNPRYLEWSYRWPLIQHEIRHLKPDIMALQEVQSSHYNTHYLPWFSHMGYRCIFKKRTGSKVDGCAIVFNAKKFQLIEENPVEFYQPKGGQILDRDNVGLIVKLTPTTFHHPFCVATTHILFNPKRADIKLAQTVLFLSELDRICYESEKGGRPSYCPLILTGDFNTEPYSGIVKLISRGSFRYAGLSKRTLKATYGPVFSTELIPSNLGLSDHCQHRNLEQGRYLEKQTGSLFSLTDKRKIENSLIKISQPGKAFDASTASSLPIGALSSGVVDHALNLKSVYYFKLDRCNGERAVTTHQDEWVTVDYIFYSRVILNSNLIEGDLKLIGRYGLLSSHEAQEIGPLPSSICPSDHFPLAAQFILKKKVA